MSLSFTAMLPPLPLPGRRTVSVMEGAKVKFRASDVTVPSLWSDAAASTLFRIWARRLPGCNGVQERWDDKTQSLVSVPGYEHSVYELVNRVVYTIGAEGIRGGYFDEANGAVFSDELRSMFLNQYGLLNTPAWVNIGATAKPQASACFIVGVGDSLASLRKWQDSETVIFNSGSGSGADLSAIRPEGWSIAGGGMASGPVSFARGTDSWAGTIKSGGRARRAAKMLTLHVTHPDIRSFITAKRDQQRKAHALIDAGFPGNWQSDTWQHLPFQNSNLSVRVTDEFMQAVINDTTYQLVWDGAVVEEPRAREIWDLICECAWETGDPGLQYDTTINKWHTVPKAGCIVSSNPCSEFLHHNDTACNLASLNLLKFRTTDGFDYKLFRHCVRLLIVAQEIICNFAGYPTPEIAENSQRFRPLGLGYCNLGALLMRSGIGYDSDEGREYAAAVTSVMGAEAYRTSAELAALVGPFEGFAENREAMLDVVLAHMEEQDVLAKNDWHEAYDMGCVHGFRNSQVTLLAPTGTIGIVMDADTTGVEPEYDLVTYKTLAGGGIARRVSGSVREALAKLGREESAITKVVQAIESTGRIGGVLNIDEHDRAVLATAAGEWPLEPAAHVRMMAAVQPFLSGGISKTVNMPSTATVEEVSEVYKLAWESGVKCVALYRDGCKRSQPLNGGAQPAPTAPAQTPPQRRSLPNDRASASAHKLSLGGHDLYMHVGYFDDGMPGELFVRMAKVGTTESCLLDALCQSVSVGLQYGVPLEKYLDKWIGTQFEPAGFTGADDIRSASSPLDLIAKKLRKLPERADYAKALAKFGTGEPFIVEKQAQQAMHDLSPCCGATYKTTGSCKTCSACGATSGGCG
jgi:ribonucleoside-diphosphate reductase alpha chain